MATLLDVKPELQQGNRGGVITITSYKFHSAAGKKTDKNICGHTNTHKVTWYEYVNKFFINI